MSASKTVEIAAGIYWVGGNDQNGGLHCNPYLLVEGEEAVLIDPFPGAIATYDYNSKTLFSSDLFGAFSYEWSLYAGDDYMEKMKTFHEHYMPSNEIIRPVMEIFLGMDIAMIAPQHGSIIKDKIQEYIKALRDLVQGPCNAAGQNICC